MRERYIWFIGIVVTTSAAVSLMGPVGLALIPWLLGGAFFLRVMVFILFDKPGSLSQGFGTWDDGRGDENFYTAHRKASRGR